jgi:hypothetical protein
LRTGQQHIASKQRKLNLAARPPARPPAPRTNKRAAAGLQKVPLAKGHFQIMKTSQCQAGCNEPDRSGTSRSRRASGQKRYELAAHWEVVA